MKVHRRYFTALIGGLAAVNWAGSASGQSKAAEVTMKSPESRFVPAVVNIAVGETVKWTNTTAVPHTVTFDPSTAATPGDAQLPEGVLSFDSGDIGANGTFSHTFDVKGTYKYFCGYHETMGMVGAIIVS